MWKQWKNSRSLIYQMMRGLCNLVTQCKFGIIPKPEIYIQVSTMCLGSVATSNS